MTPTKPARALTSRFSAALRKLTRFGRAPAKPTEPVSARGAIQARTTERRPNPAGPDQSKIYRDAQGHFYRWVNNGSKHNPFPPSIRRCLEDGTLIKRVRMSRRHRIALRRATQFQNVVVHS